MVICVSEIVARTGDILLRRTGPKDLEFVCTAEQGEENRDFVSQQTVEQHLETINNENMLHLIVEDNSRSVGYLIMAGIKNQSKCMELKRIVITTKGKGYGRSALRACKEIAFDMHGAHRLWLDVVHYNKRAQSLYLSEGFVQEGILRECDYYKGEYQSLIIMSILEDEYRALCSK